MKPPFEMIVETEMEKYRYETFWIKEPETIAWIQSFNSHNTFFDIGANIGIYSLYAASLYPNSLIHAFEPVRSNAKRLIENIELNGFDNIIVWPFAITNYSKMGILFVKSKEIGHSGSQIDQLKEQKPFEEYWIPAITIDDVADKWDFPNYVKIDIDGREDKVIEGGLKTLYHPSCKSCLVEINNNTGKIKNIFKGLDYSTDNEFNSHPEHSRYRREKEGIKVENIIFTRR